MNNKELVMSFDPKTIEHLGIKMYSHLPNAIAELIANAYDACATEVLIHLIDKEDEKKIIIMDNGEGMRFEEINEKFLVIGRNRRKEGEIITVCGRMATGKKGLGKLAFFGIGETIVIETCKKGEKTKFILDWQELINTTGVPYKPKYEITECNKFEKGTKITLLKLKRKSKFNLESLIKGIAGLFNFLDDFNVFIQLNDNKKILIDNKLKYNDIDMEFEWIFPKWLKTKNLCDYEYNSRIKGKIITSKYPLKPGLRGITLFANGRLVNKAEFFANSESSHFFSYVTGWLDIDFIDEWEEDVISTNRQSLDWENNKIQKLRDFLSIVINEIHKEWREQRKEKKHKNFKNKTKIDFKEWYSKTPFKIKEKLEPVIEKIIEESELGEKETGEIIKNLHELLPEYTYYHYRFIHPEIAEISKKFYEQKNYYGAVLEAIKRYINKVSEKSLKYDIPELQLVSSVFGKKGVLKTVQKYKRLNGNDFRLTTKENIEEGQKFLSMGIIKGVRHPVAHEEITDLRESGMFTEKDCLDILSLVSHLMRRLDDVELNDG